MNPSKISTAGSSRLGDGLTAGFVFAYPLLALVVRGSASALMIAAILVSLGVLTFSRGSRAIQAGCDSDRLVKLTCIALMSPLCTTLASELWHRQVVFSLLDAPWRFIAAIPILLALRRMPLRAVRWSDCSFAVGAIGALAAGLMSPVDEGSRLRLPFLDSIHYGDMALVMGLLSALSIDWWRKDHALMRAFKLAGLLAGLAASVFSGSRGGWLAIPVIVPLVVSVWGKRKSPLWRMSVLLALFAVLLAAATASHEVHTRMSAVWSEIVEYSKGQRDTSTGIRLQLFQVALELTWRHPLFGAGPDGFAHAMQSFQSAGIITPKAALFGYGETHNQLLAYTANYGLIAGVAGLAVHVVPGWLFARHLNAPANPARRAALLGLTFVISFFIFGLSVETFDLKMVVSFYAVVVAILAGIVISPAVSRTAASGHAPSINGTQSQCSAS